MGELVSQRVEGSNRQTLPSVNTQIFQLSLGLRRRFFGDCHGRTRPKPKPKPHNPSPSRPRQAACPPWIMMTG